MSRDLLDRRVLEEELERRDAQLRLLLCSANAIAFVWDVQEDRVRRPYSSEPALPETGARVEKLEDVMARVVPEDREKLRRDISDALTDPSGQYTSSFRVAHEDGTVAWLEERGYVKRDKNGLPSQLFGISFDVTEPKRHESELKSQLAEIVALYDNAPVGLGLIDRDMRFLRINDALAEINGIPKEALIGRRVWDVVPSLRSEVEPKLRQVFETGHQFEMEVSGETPKAPGVKRHWLERYYPLKDQNSEVVAVGVTCDEITDQKRAQEHQKLILGEMNHRSKNLLQVVQTIARMTMGSDPQEFLRCFSDRIQALSIAQNLLIESNWDKVPLRSLVEQQVAHVFSAVADRVAVQGPRLLISPSSAQTLAMAIHELCTNAVKHGALSNAEGDVFLAWSTSLSEDGIERFEMSWTERGGPPVRPPSRAGFGTRVLQEAVQRGLSASVQANYLPDGFSWTMKCDLVSLR